MNTNKTYEDALKREAEALKQKYTRKQLEMADYLYVYVLDCDDEKARAKFPACRDMLDAMDRLWKLDEENEYLDEDIRHTLGLSGSADEVFKLFDLGPDFQNKSV